MIWILMKKQAFLLVLAAACAVLSGCETEPAELEREADPYLTQSRIQYESHLTNKIVKVVRVDTDRIGSGLLKVIVTLRNETKKNLWIEIRTTFLDANGHVLEQTNWEPIALSARTVSEYSINSLATQAADYQIIMRKPAETSKHLP